MNSRSVTLDRMLRSRRVEDFKAEKKLVDLDVDNPLSAPKFAELFKRYGPTAIKKVLDYIQLEQESKADLIKAEVYSGDKALEFSKRARFGLELVFMPDLLEVFQEDLQSRKAGSLEIPKSYTGSEGDPMLWFHEVFLTLGVRSVEQTLDPVVRGMYIFEQALVQAKIRTTAEVYVAEEALWSFAKRGVFPSGVSTQVRIFVKTLWDNGIRSSEMMEKIILCRGLIKVREKTGAFTGTANVGRKSSLLRNKARSEPLAHAYEPHPKEKPLEDRKTRTFFQPETILNPLRSEKHNIVQVKAPKRAPLIKVPQITELRSRYSIVYSLLTAGFNTMGARMALLGRTVIDDMSILRDSTRNVEKDADLALARFGSDLHQMYLLASTHVNVLGSVSSTFEEDENLSEDKLMSIYRWFVVQAKSMEQGWSSEIERNMKASSPEVLRKVKSIILKNFSNRNINAAYTTELRSLVLTTYMRLQNLHYPSSKDVGGAVGCPMRTTEVPDGVRVRMIDQDRETPMVDGAPLNGVMVLAHASAPLLRKAFKASLSQRFHYNKPETASQQNSYRRKTKYS